MRRYGHVIILAIILLAVIYWMYPHKESKREVQRGQVARDESATKSSASIKNRPAPKRAVATQDSVQPTTSTPEAQATDNTKAEKCFEALRQKREQDKLDGKFTFHLTGFGEWLWNKSEKPPRGKEMRNKPNFEKFMAALALDGQLSGHDRFNDSKRAFRSLMRLSHSDPGNSAPGMFAAIILFRQGKVAEARALLNRLDATTTHFNSYFGDFSRSLYLDAKTPEEFMEAVELVSTAPVPDYDEFREVMKEIAPSGLLRQMTADGMNDRKTQTDIDWSMLEYAIGHLLLEKRNEAGGLIDRRSLLQHKTGLASTLKYIDAMYAFGENCDLEALRPFLDELHDHLQRQSR